MLNYDKHKEEIYKIFKDGKSLCDVSQKFLKAQCCGCSFDEEKRANCKIKTFEWLCQEYKEPILSEEEKKILRGVIEAIKPFTDVKPLILRGIRDKTKPYIVLCYGDEDICLPTFKDTMFENLELDKPYGLEELGLC